ncbi:unnamed protein product [Protopolystoma xenopodis]|uniref:Uncharacterized protein n=1 Tax=Protopolystoma xenopodis TaxID=117903 RepID=A0A3S5CKE3_9PLAT|nr:unnamed protein product [Protopolystoma xenopodis]
MVKGGRVDKKPTPSLTGINPPLRLTTILLTNIASHSSMHPPPLPSNYRASNRRSLPPSIHSTSNYSFTNSSGCGVQIRVKSCLCEWLAELLYPRRCCSLSAVANDTRAVVDYAFFPYAGPVMKRYIWSITVSCVGDPSKITDWPNARLTRRQAPVGRATCMLGHTDEFAWGCEPHAFRHCMADRLVCNPARLLPIRRR